MRPAPASLVLGQAAHAASPSSRRPGRGPAPGGAISDSRAGEAASSSSSSSSVAAAILLGSATGAEP